MGTTADKPTVVEATADRPLRIGELAELTGTTPRTIRYWEELGLLGTAPGRAEGQHRSYAPADVQRVSEIARLRKLLGLTLEQLSSLLDAESARAHLREELAHAERPERRRAILQQLRENIAGQLALVRGRQRELEDLARELEDKQRLVHLRLHETEG